MRSSHPASKLTLLLVAALLLVVSAHAVTDFSPSGNINMQARNITNVTRICYADGTCASTSSGGGGSDNTTFNQTLTDSLYLGKNDQRYNETVSIATVNTSANIGVLGLLFGFNKTTDLKTYFDTLYLAIGSLSGYLNTSSSFNGDVTGNSSNLVVNQKFNETQRITDLNSSLTSNDSSQAALIGALQGNGSGFNTSIGNLNTNASNQQSLIDALRGNLTNLNTNVTSSDANLSAANVTLNASVTNLIGRVNSINSTACTGGNSTHANVSNATSGTCIMVMTSFTTPASGSGMTQFNLSTDKNTSVIANNSAINISAGSGISIVHTGGANPNITITNIGLLTDVYINSTGDNASGVYNYNLRNGTINIQPDGRLLVLSYNGSSNTMQIVDDGNGTAQNAFNVVSSNNYDSAVGINGNESGRGTVKIVHNQPNASDASASAISILLNGNARGAAQGIFMDHGNSTGDILSVQNGSGTEIYEVNFNGSTRITADGANNLLVENGAGTDTLRVDNTAGLVRTRKVVPTVTDASDLGDGSLRWRNLTVNNVSAVALFENNKRVCLNDSTNCVPESDPVWSGNASRVTNLESANQTLNTSITNANTNASNQQTLIDALRGNLTNLNTNVTVSLSNLSAANVTLNLSVTNAYMWLNNLSKDNQTLNTSVTNLNTRVSNLETANQTVNASVINLNSIVVNNGNFSGNASGWKTAGAGNYSAWNGTAFETRVDSQGSGGYTLNQSLNWSDTATFAALNISPKTGDANLYMNSTVRWTALSIQDSGANLKMIDPDGAVICTLNKDSDSQVCTNVGATSSYNGATALTVTGASGLTVDLAQFKNSSGTVMIRVEANGTLNASKGIRTNLSNCDVLNTSADGTLQCDTDGGGSVPYQSSAAGWRNITTDTVTDENVTITANQSSRGLNVLGNNDGYFEINVQNKNYTSNNASSDVTATAPNGNTTHGFINFGINSPNFVGPWGGAWDGYLYTYGNATYPGNLLIGTNLSANLSLWTSGTERVRVTSSGSVGIGTTTPNQALMVAGNENITGTSNIGGNSFSNGRQLVLGVTDFWCDFTGTQSTNMCYPYYGASGISSGTSATYNGNWSTPGWVTFASAAGSNVGYWYGTSQSAIQLNGSEQFSAQVILLPMNITNASIVRIGFWDSTNNVADTDAAMFYIINNTNVGAKTCSASTCNSTGPSGYSNYTLPANNWTVLYVVKLTNDATKVNFTMYNVSYVKAANVLLYNVTLQNNIPTGTTNQVGSGIDMLYTTTTGAANILGYADFMLTRFPNATRMVMD